MNFRISDTFTQSFARLQGDEQKAAKAAASPPQPTQDPFAHPDAKRRFRLMTDVEELSQALEFQWDRWTIFLHPAQQATVERTYNGPARVAGSASSGKTDAALQNQEVRVVLTTFCIPQILKLNYRTSHQIRRQADRLLNPNSPMWTA